MSPFPTVSIRYPQACLLAVFLARGVPQHRAIEGLPGPASPLPMRLTQLSGAEPHGLLRLNNIPWGTQQFVSLSTHGRTFGLLPPRAELFSTEADAFYIPTEMRKSHNFSTCLTMLVISH